MKGGNIMTEQKSPNLVDFDQIKQLGLDAIKEPRCRGNEYYLKRYLDWHLKIYESGLEVLRLKASFYKDLNKGSPFELAMSIKILPRVSNIKDLVDNRIKEINKKIEQITGQVQNLPDKLQHLAEDDQDFRRKMLQADEDWHYGFACRQLGFCICQTALYPPYQASCMNQDDFTIIRIK